MAPYLYTASLLLSVFLLSGLLSFSLYQTGGWNYRGWRRFGSPKQLYIPLYRSASIFQLRRWLTGWIAVRHREGRPFSDRAVGWWLFPFKLKLRFSSLLEWWGSVRTQRLLFSLSTLYNVITLLFVGFLYWYTFNDPISRIYELDQPFWIPPSYTKEFINLYFPLYLEGFTDVATHYFRWYGPLYQEWMKLFVREFGIGFPLIEIGTGAVLALLPVQSYVAFWHAIRVHHNSAALMHSLLHPTGGGELPNSGGLRVLTQQEVRETAALFAHVEYLMRQCNRLSYLVIPLHLSLTLLFLYGFPLSSAAV